MDTLKTTNTLLLIIVLPLIFYLLKVLSFIFIPLTLSLFIALLLLPIMRWLTVKRLPRFLSIIIIVLIVFGVLRVGAELLIMSSHEIMSEGNTFFEKAETKIVDLIVMIEGFVGIERMADEKVMSYYFQGDILEKFGSTFGFVRSTLSITLMTVFFVILLLYESIDFEKVMNKMIFKQKYSSVKTFMKIEKDIIKFVIVKFIISLFTGLGFGLACFFFDVSFPIFWGLFAFVINFVQMIGSVISVVLLALFAFIELEISSTLLFFILTITLVQAVFGGVLEPVFMGKTFSLNIITVLIMLMLWGYVWGIPGLIMSIPITVFIKIILEHFPRTKTIASLMSAPEVDRKPIIKKSLFKS